MAMPQLSPPIGGPGSPIPNNPNYYGWDPRSAITQALMSSRPAIPVTQPGPGVGGADIAQPTIGMGGATAGTLGAVGTPTNAATGNQGMIDQPTIGMAPGTNTKATPDMAPKAAPQPYFGPVWGNFDNEAMSQMQFPGSGTGGG